jgi:hypothetical protein
MNTNNSLQVDLAIAICIWGLLVIALVVTATWRSQVVPSEGSSLSPQQTNVAEIACGSLPEKMTRTQSASPMSRAPARSKPSAVATSHDSNPEEVAAVGALEFYDWF